MGGGEARTRARRRSARLREERRRSSGAGEAAAAAAEAAAAAAEARQAAAAAERAARRARDAARRAEVEDSPRSLHRKCRALARAMRRAKHLVVMTGAGVSTAAAIPDYRGPGGVWTRLRRGEAAPRVDLAAARPTFTHRALAALHRARRLRFLISQNCDALHVRAGTPRRRLAELHGDAFLERCAHCGQVYARSFDTTGRTARFAHGTRRLCHACGRELRDTIVHFGEEGRAAWPLNWAGALRHAAAADVLVCLGSSLRVLRRYPRLFSMHLPPQRRPRLYIVNLQWTPKDAAATLKINARCDDVMAEVARLLRLRVPRYKPSRDPLLAHATPLAPQERHTARSTGPSCALASLADASTSATSASSSSSGSSSSGSSSASSSDSATDSEDERPLQQLVTRPRDPPAALARPPPDPPPPLPLPPPPREPHDKQGSFTSFQVNLSNGVATILLQMKHVPVPPSDPPRKPLSELRSYRMAKFVGGAQAAAVRPAPAPAPAPDDCKDDLKPLSVLFGIKSEKEEKPPPPVEEVEGVEERARRIIERAVALCRAGFYPGLHCIVAPEVAAPAPPPQCAWCWRRERAPRCLWYPRRDPLAPRAWRRVRGARYLCACCPRPRAAATPPPHARDEPGWYGKGCRKGVPRRRR